MRKQPQTSFPIYLSFGFVSPPKTIGSGQILQTRLLELISFSSLFIPPMEKPTLITFDIVSLLVFELEGLACQLDLVRLQVVRS